MSTYVKWFSEIGIKDVPEVGGKNASLGEMYRNLTDEGVRVPNGFAITASAYHYVLDENDAWKKLHAALDGLAPEKEKKMIFTDTINTDNIAVEYTRNIETDTGERGRFCITDEDIMVLADYAVKVENHYSQKAGFHKPMDMEWAKDGICGQAPSDYPEVAEYLVKLGIDSISLNPDCVLKTIQDIDNLESKT